MKLVHYTSRILFVLLFVLLAIWGVLFYITIMDEVMDETDDSLENYREILVGKVLSNPELLETEDNILHRYIIRHISEEEALHYHEQFYDDVIYIETEDEYEPVRVMKSCFLATNNQYYELELRISTLERYDMIEAIYWYLCILFTLLLFFISLGNRLILRQVFTPLQRLLQWLQQLTPGKPVPQLINETKVREFRQLSEAALDMSRRSEKAYQEQKQFIENASHELQTPLAIAKGKLELLAEGENLTEEQYRDIDELYRTLGRAVKLNKSLLLLSRIENGQYPDVSSLCINQLVKETLDELVDVYEWKQVQVTVVEAAELYVQMNDSLAQILVTNLLKNAFVHNEPGGELHIRMASASLQISNTGSSPLDDKRIFQRFYRADLSKKESTGLGLAVVKSISELYSIHIHYSFVSHMHTFSLNFVK